MIRAAWSLRKNLAPNDNPMAGKDNQYHSARADLRFIKQTLCHYLQQQMGLRYFTKIGARASPSFSYMAPQ
jgi:hypothetical protein